VDDPDPPHAALVEHVRRVRGVVTADGDQAVDVEAQQRGDAVLQVPGLFGGVGAADADVGPTAEVDAADVADREGHDVVDVALHDPFEAVLDADDIGPCQGSADGRRPDDAVDAWRRSTACEDCESLDVRVHASSLRLMSDAHGETR